MLCTPLLCNWHVAAIFGGVDPLDSWEVNPDFSPIALIVDLCVTTAALLAPIRFHWLCIIPAAATILYAVYIGALCTILNDEQQNRLQAYVNSVAVIFVL